MFKTKKSSKNLGFENSDMFRASMFEFRIFDASKFIAKIKKSGTAPMNLVPPRMLGDIHRIIR